MTPAIYKILAKANEGKTKHEVADVLKANSSKALKTILDYTFNSTLRFELPPGAPPYTPLEGEFDFDVRLHQEAMKLYTFLPTTKLPRARKEQLFIQMLESVHPNDALVLIGVKDKALPYSNVTKEAVQIAFPTLIKE